MVNRALPLTSNELSLVALRAPARRVRLIPPRRVAGLSYSNCQRAMMVG
jgi:hypothetical protein